MAGFYLNEQEISAAITAFHQFPERTPGRWGLVSKLMQELLKEVSNDIRFPFGRKQCSISMFSVFICNSLHFCSF